MTFRFVEKGLQYKEWSQVQLTQLLYCKVTDDMFRPMLWGAILSYSCPKTKIYDPFKWRELSDDEMASDRVELECSTTKAMYV